MAARRPGTERDAFWHTYGPRPTTPAARRRSLIYQGCHHAAIRLERHRLGRTDLRDTYDEIRGILHTLKG